MKILVVHNRYQQRGGEDAVVDAEIRLLQAHGHRVVQYQRHNDELKRGGPLVAISAGISTLWSSRSLREVRNLIAKEQPDVAHFHNTFPLISPATYNACTEARVPVIQTLHNYRLLCPSATLLRDGMICEACVGRKVAWPSVRYGCYGGHATTAAVATMLALHRAMGTWREKVDQYVALSEFARQKFIQGGLPAERIVVKPNFVDLEPRPRRELGEYALFVGRLAEEKGLRVLLKAWDLLRTDIPLRIAGDGPLMQELANEIQERHLHRVELTGPLHSQDIIHLMRGARFLVIPSVWFEGFPLTLIEAFACGLPVIASRLGAIEELLENGRTGIQFAASDPTDLARKVEWAWAHGPELDVLARQARLEFESKYTPEGNYISLMEIYYNAITNRQSVDSSRSHGKDKKLSFQSEEGD